MEVRCKKSAKGMKLASPSSSCFITNLPTPILMEILCRLPIETLTACKIVCKSWLNLSRDPHFAQLHQARAPTEVCFQLWDDRELHMGNFHCLNNVKFNALFEIPQFSVEPNNTLDYRAGAGGGYFNFSNSCNGLLCYHGGDCNANVCRNKFALVWNPCTSEFITLPELATPFCCRYGLGFSKKTNKFKLLRLVSQRISKNAVAEICTIEKGCSWNTLGPCPSYVLEVIDNCIHSYKDPIFLHNTLHWPSNSDINILTFDFEDDQFGRVPLPPSFDKISSRLYRVGELLGCLFITEYTNEVMNIWLMKEYGVQDSWMKMYSLPGILMGKRLNQNGFLPVTCMDNSEILLADVGCSFTRVFSYNPDQEGFRLIGSGHGLFLRVIAYKPSLVPLKDSMLGYKVHVRALKRREKSTSRGWWTCLTEGGKRKRHVKATSQSSVLPIVSAVGRRRRKREGRLLSRSKSKQNNSENISNGWRRDCKMKDEGKTTDTAKPAVGRETEKRTCKGKAAGREVQQSKKFKEEI